MPMLSVPALRRSLGFSLLFLLLAPWVVSAYTFVQTEALFPEPRSWHVGQQGWFGGLATGFSLFDEATAWGPAGEVSLDLDPGALMVGIVGYDLGALRFAQEVAWHRAPLNAISDEVMRVEVIGETTQFKLLSRNRFAFRFTPGSPHVAYVSLGLGALKETIEFEDRATGLVHDESQWAFVYELLAGAVYKVLNDNNLRIGIRAASAESNKRALLESWFNFGLGRWPAHRAYIGGNVGAVDSNAQPWSLGYQLGAGMVFLIADRTVFGIDYRYVAMPTFTAHTPGISLRYNF